MHIAIGSDHAGYGLKAQVAEHLRDEGHEVADLGTHDEQSTDYPGYAHGVARAVLSGKAELGIVICGSGNGVNITANKHVGIRSVLAWIPEIAELGRRHNNANVLALPGRFVSGAEGIAITDAFLAAHFEGGRHQRRVEAIEGGTQEA